MIACSQSSISSATRRFALALVALALPHLPCAALDAPSAQDQPAGVRAVRAKEMKRKVEARPERAEAPRPVGDEIRAIWITRWDYRTAEDVRAIVRNCAWAGFNTLYFQVRGEGTSFYQSSIEPWAGELSGTPSTEVSMTGRDPGWRPLELALEEAKRHGVELHAYMNVLPGWNHETLPPRASGQLAVAHPEWFMMDAKGRRMTKKLHGFYAFLNPARPEVRAHLARVFADVARRYPDLAGIHLDYLRYPDPVEARGNSFSYDSVGLAQFKKLSQGKRPSEAPELWDRFCAAQVNQVLDAIVKAVGEANPRLEVSCAVVANYKTAQTTKAQHWLDWSERYGLGAVAPMAYHYDMAKYGAYLETCLGATRPRRGKVIVGIWPNEAWEKRGFTRARMAEQIALARRKGADGIALFAYSRFFPGHKPNAWARYLKERCLSATPAR